MIKLNEIDFKNFTNDLINRKSNFILESKRNVSSIIIDGKQIALSKNNNHFADKKIKKEVVLLFSKVAKCINNYIKLNNFQIEKIEQIHPSSLTNREKYRKLKVGDKFYYVDISHCYWRIAFLKNYISKKLYEDVLKKPELKIYRNMALACIVAPKKRKYYKNGELFIEISEDKELWKVIYDNIRFTSYNIVGEIANNNQVKKYFIAYRTDGIMITKPALKIVEIFLKKFNLEYKIYNCLKIDDNHYFFDSKKVKKI